MSTVVHCQWSRSWKQRKLWALGQWSSLTQRILPSEMKKAANVTQSLSILECENNLKLNLSYFLCINWVRCFWNNILPIDTCTGEHLLLIALGPCLLLGVKCWWEPVQLGIWFPAGWTGICKHWRISSVVICRALLCRGESCCHGPVSHWGSA